MCVCVFPQALSHLNVTIVYGEGSQFVSTEFCGISQLMASYSLWECSKPGRSRAVPFCITSFMNDPLCNILLQGKIIFLFKQN